MQHNTGKAITRTRAGNHSFCAKCSFSSFLLELTQEYLPVSDTLGNIKNCTQCTQ